MRPLRFGVEEEYLLVDARTRTTVPRAPSVLRDVSRVLGNRAQAEFYATQIEGCTPRCAPPPSCAHTCWRSGRP